MNKNISDFKTFSEVRKKSPKLPSTYSMVPKLRKFRKYKTDLGPKFLDCKFTIKSQNFV